MLQALGASFTSFKRSDKVGLFKLFAYCLCYCQFNVNKFKKKSDADLDFSTVSKLF